MSLVSTKTPIFDDVPSIEFFNGRLLSGEDMTTEQAWNAARRKLLGQALGSGVAFGLEVRISEKSEHAGKPIVSVDPGLALNAGGEVLSLAEPTDVSLAKVDESEAVPAEFSTCLPTQYSAYVKSDGVYLLTLCPAAGTQGRAPVSGLANQEARCNRKYRREGVQFRLHQIKLTEAELADRNRLRNLVAYKCFDPDAWQTFVTDPFAAPAARPKLLDGLLVPKLEDSEVPLATVFWTTDGGIEYVDLWSVRRQLLSCVVEPNYAPRTDHWEMVEADARVRQFVQHLDDVVRAAENPSAEMLANHCRYLPPIGIAPMAGSGSPRGFRHDVFFGTLPSGDPTVIEWSDAISLFADAGGQAAFDVQRTDVIQLYWVRENLSAIAEGDSTQLYLVFTTRAIHGFRERDDVTAVLTETWKAYGSLFRKGVLVPKTSTNDAIPVATAIAAGHQHVVQYAMANETAAAARLLNRPAVMHAFTSLHALQSEFASSLQLTYTGDDDHANRVSFAGQLLVLLDANLPSGAHGLKRSLEADTFHGVLAAQRAINALANTWGGEFVSGYVQVQYSGNEEGDCLVPGRAAAFVFAFDVTSRLEKRASITIDASVEDEPSGSWGDAIRIEDPVTNALVTGFSPTLNPDEGVRIRVFVKAPSDVSGADMGEALTLRARAAIGPPTDKAWTCDHELTVADEPCVPQPWVLNTELASGGNIENAAPATRYQFLFDSEFTASRPPTSTTATFTATFTFQNSVRGDWNIYIAGHAGAETPANSGVLTYTFTLPTDVLAGKERTDIKVTTPEARGTTDKIASFTLQVTTDIVDPETGDVVRVAADIEEQFRVVLKATGT